MILLKCKIHLAITLSIWVVDAKLVTASLGLKIHNFKLNFCSVRECKCLDDFCVPGILPWVVWCLELSLSLSFYQIVWWNLGPCGQEALPILQDVAFKPKIHLIPFAGEWSRKFLPTVLGDTLDTLK